MKKFKMYSSKESHHHTGRDRHLWGYNTLEEIQRLGQQTYQRALRNHAAWTASQGQPTLDPVHSKKSQQRTAACPICGKSVEPNQLDSAFSDVMKMMGQISQTCQKYYCTSEGEPLNIHDKKHCLRYHTTKHIRTSDAAGRRKTNLRDTNRSFSVHGGPSPSAKSAMEGIKCKRHTTFDVAASLPNTRKAKHVRFSPGETVEVQFCA